MPPRPTRDTAAATFARKLNELQRAARALSTEDFGQAIDEALRRLEEQRREVIAMDNLHDQLKEMTTQRGATSP
jgi:hypothetical protein